MSLFGSLSRSFRLPQSQRELTVCVPADGHYENPYQPDYPRPPWRTPSPVDSLLELSPTELRTRINYVSKLKNNPHDRHGRQGMRKVSIYSCPRASVVMLTMLPSKDFRQIQALSRSISEQVPRPHKGLPQAQQVGQAEKNPGDTGGRGMVVSRRGLGNSLKTCRIW